MIVQVRLFAAAKDLAGCNIVSVELPDGSRVADLRAKLIEQTPALAQILDHVLFSINAEYATDQSSISAADEVACIPPVSGG